jgi:hypothetical protein
MSKKVHVLTAAVVAALAMTAPALATPVATNDAEYGIFGRVFPDPLAGCTPGVGLCSPNAQGNVSAAQFIQWQELLDGLRYLNSKDHWNDYLEVLVLDGRLGDGSGSTAGSAMFPGNDGVPLEFTPRPEYVSAGLPTTTLERKKSDLVVVRVTNESVPDKNKKRVALSLSIHGIERAGVEGATRAIEDLVTGDKRQPIVSETVKPDAATIQEVLDETIIYFSYPNPDGWRRGSVTEGGVFFQRYNGNGVDLNRDWPDIGYAFRGYSGLSEPESRALHGFLRDVEANAGGFAAGDDLHGQGSADALSYTMLPHGRHDWAKDQRLRQTAIAINQGTYDAIKWSPAIQPNDAPQPTCAGASLIQPCTRIYAQTWGTVYDTINYTTTGTLGDWFDSRAGLNADGIDNEMSFSHLDRNIVFDPHGEQLHVDGNKALLYAHLADLIDPPAVKPFTAAGSKAYVPNLRLRRDAQKLEKVPNRTDPQPDIVDARGTPSAELEGQTVFPFKVYRKDPHGQQRGIYNGGMRVDVTTTNVGGIGTGLVTLRVECRGCDDAHGGGHEDEWVTVAEDFNQSPVYAQAGVTVAVNRPKGTPEGTDWRAIVSQGSAVTRMDVDFTTSPASTDGNTGGDEPPMLAGYDVANTDIFKHLNAYVPDTASRFSAVEPRSVIDGTATLTDKRSVVLADDALPGYTGTYDGEPEPPSGPPTQGFQFEDTKPTTPGQGPLTCERIDATTDYHPFTIGANDGNAKLEAVIHWESSLYDWDLYLERKDASGAWTQAAAAGNSNLNTSEELALSSPPAGDYRLAVVNCSALDTNYAGSLSFTPLPPAPASAFTAAEKDAWFAKLGDYVRSGGNLLLTDGALRALPEITGIPRDKVERRLVYAGQTAFATGSGATPTSGPNTLSDPLAADIRQPGARFNSNVRRQTFEPSPLGFFVDSTIGATARVGSPQWDVDRAAFEAAGGRTVGVGMTSSGTNVTMRYDRVTLGEMQLGSGTIRIAGGLLPQPSTENDHPLGVEPYALTYSGYILLRNLVAAPN